KGAAAASVRERAERLRQQIGKRMLGLGDRKLHVTASAGLAELVAGDTVTDWVARADRALYTAKSGGRDCAFEVRGDKLERVMLARLDGPVHSAEPSEAEELQSPIRIALNVARLCVREMDLVTRWHAEGLAFLLPGTSASETKTVARRFRAALAANNTGGARP